MGDSLIFGTGTCPNLLRFVDVYITGLCLVMSLNEAIEQEGAGGSHHAGLFFSICSG